MSEIVTGGLLEPFAYGRGFEEVILGVAPGAGLNFTSTLPGDFDSRLRSLTFTLTTGAAAANRAVTVDYDDGSGNVYCSQGAGTVVLASSTQKFSYAVGRGDSEFAAGTTVFCPLVDLFLKVGHKVQINVAGIQAADTLTLIVLTFERFPTGPRGYPEGQEERRARRQSLSRLGSLR